MTVETRRVTALDGLRGWAALSVMFCHMMQTSPSIWAAFTETSHANVSKFSISEILTYTPLHLFWAGGEAVALFFVLSGYVLAAGFWSGDGPSYKSFVIRRIFRIYPAFLVVCVLAWLAATVVESHSVAGVSVWFYQYWHRPGGIVNLLPALFMGYGVHLNLIPPTWSLVCEMRISLIFPMIIWLMRRTGPWLLPAAVVVSAAFKLAEQHFHLSLAATLWLTTGAQLWLFVLGAELNRRGPGLAARVGSLGPIASWSLFGLALMMLIARWIAPLPLPLCYLLSGLGAGALIVLAAGGGGIGRVLDSRLSQLFGKLSYSLYLVHFPVLAVLVYGLAPRAPLWVALALTPVVTIAMAAVLQRAVERPFIRFGRVLTTR